VEDYIKRLALGVEVILPLKKLMIYMNSFWFERVGPSRFSVFLEQHRTNNVVESWHRSLNRKMIGKHLTLWKFIGNVLRDLLRLICCNKYYVLDQLQSIDHVTVRDFYNRKDQGLEIRRKAPKADVRSSNEIWQLMSDLHSSKLTVKPSKKFKV
jgi:hypothetical protein